MVNVSGTTITVTKGDTFSAIVEICLADGSPYEVQEDDEIRFALKKRYSDKVPLIWKSIPNETLRLFLDAEDTKRLSVECSPYVYDIQITMADGTVDTFIDRGKFIVTEEVD